MVDEPSITRWSFQEFHLRDSGVGFSSRGGFSGFSVGVDPRFYFIAWWSMLAIPENFNTLVPKLLIEKLQDFFILCRAHSDTIEVIKVYVTIIIIIINNLFLQDLNSFESTLKSKVKLEKHNRIMKMALPLTGCSLQIKIEKITMGLLLERASYSDAFPIKCTEVKYSEDGKTVSEIHAEYDPEKKSVPDTTENSKTRPDQRQLQHQHQHQHQQTKGKGSSRPTTAAEEHTDSKYRSRKLDNLYLLLVFNLDN